MNEKLRFDFRQPRDFSVI